ncbi:MAG: M14 family metallopeptidase [Vicinamibacteria bacterium]
MTACALALLLAVAPSPSLGPGTRFDPRIPTLEQVTGHATGQAITTPDGVHAYLAALAAAAPDRTRLVEYARSEEGRPLEVLVIASPERIARIEEVKRSLRALADPRALPPSEADRLVRELPAVVWLLHAVHGNEASSTDAALALAYHLLAAQDDPAAEAARKDAIVLLDPLQNPDGRARFLATNRAAVGLAPDAEPFSAEHDEPWPGGRANHYLFDMNRDWFAQTQPETRGRLRVFLEWFPQVAADLHEMGGDSTYYFAPPAKPFNPHFSSAQHDWLEAFGRAIAERFDEAGQAYFVRDVFDSFYPGYGESWPMTHGAVGMTFEQASARGMTWRRDDGSELTYLDGVRNHFRAGLATVETAARGREKLLRDFLEFRRAALREGETGPVRAYVLPPGVDPSRARRLAELLVAQGIEVRVAAGDLQGGGRAFPAGSYVVPAAQPAGRLVRNLLDPRVAMDDAFVKEQDRRRKKRLPDQIYDVTAWSLPLLFDVECASLAVAPIGETQPFGAVPAPATTAPLAPAKVAWLLPWGSGTAAAVAEALGAGLKVRVAEAGFRLAGRDWPSGTAIFRAAENPADAATTLGRVAARHGVSPAPVDSGFVEDGVSLGGERVHVVPRPRVMLLWDRPTSSTSAGWARWVLERRYGQPVTVVRTASLRRADLRRFDVIVMPSGEYGEALGGSVARLRDWVEGGGTLVALGEASRWLTREKVGLLATKTELRDGRPEGEDEGKGDRKDESGGKDKGPAKEPFDLEKAIQPERERPDAVPGALLRVDLDREHWLAAGTDGALQALVESRRIFTPLKLDKGRNVGVYGRKDDVVASGLVWDETRDQLAQKAFLMDQPAGEGHVIAFAEDPNNRGCSEGTELLFVNAVLLGPAY